jgi:hypothetical protein
MRMRDYEAPTLSEIGSVEELTLSTNLATVAGDDGGNS